MDELGFQTVVSLWGIRAWDTGLGERELTAFEAQTASRSSEADP
jgi:hypothetical protein